MAKALGRDVNPTRTAHLRRTSNLSSSSATSFGQLLYAFGESRGIFIPSKSPSAKFLCKFSSLPASSCAGVGAVGMSNVAVHGACECEKGDASMAGEGIGYDGVC